MGGGYLAPMHLMATKGVHGDNARKELDEHVRGPYHVVLVGSGSVCIDLRDSQVGILLDELHRRDFGVEVRGSGVEDTWCPDVDPSCPATAIIKVENAHNVVTPRGNIIQGCAVEAMLI